MALSSFRTLLERIKKTDEVWEKMGKYQLLVRSKQWYSRPARYRSPSTAFKKPEMSKPENLNEIPLKNFLRPEARQELRKLQIFTTPDLVTKGWTVVFKGYRYIKHDAAKSILDLAVKLRSNESLWSLMTEEQKDAWDIKKIEKVLYQKPKEPKLKRKQHLKNLRNLRETLKSCPFVYFIRNKKDEEAWIRFEEGQ